MNRLNKILLSFVLPVFCLLISVSNAEIIQPNEIYQYNLGANSYLTSGSAFGSSYSTINSAVNDYMMGVSSEAFNALKEYYDSNNINYIITKPNIYASKPYGIFLWEDDLSIDCGYDDVNKKIFINSYTGSNKNYVYHCYYKSTGASNCFRVQDSRQIGYTLYETNIKSMKAVVCDTTSNPMTATWDGTSYYIELDDDTPPLPSNSEIASAVQAFYNSDYYKNNTEFDDFFVLYNYDNQYFSFIGHNYEDKFQQLIFPAGHKYNQQWWKFGLDGLITELSSYIFNKYYWLYSTNDFGENFSYDGKGLLSDLLNLNFSTSSTIVYSTNEYDVVVYSYNENNELTNEMDTMPGDQYTYDENLDPTTNEYNPLENFVPTNPSQSILGDVNFDEINKTFEENKDILNIEGASWLFTANNQLINYFIGFLSLLIVFLIISRILGG